MTPDLPPPPEDVPPVSAESLIDGAVAEDAPDMPRTYPSTIGGAFYLVVLAVATGGLLITWLVDWRIGLEIFGGSLCFAAIARAVLHRRDAGMLAVRSKPIDTVLLLTLGIAIIVLAATIPSR